MGVPKAKKPKQIVYQLTEAKFKKIMEDIRRDTLQQSLILFGAWMMEEPNIDCDEDKLLDLWKSIENYAEHIDKHNITINTVCDIIQEKTGLDVKCCRKPLHLD